MADSAAACTEGPQMADSAAACTDGPLRRISKNRGQQTRKGKEAGPSAEDDAAKANEHAAKKQKKGKGQPAPQPSEWFELKNNTNVYVAGLPLDVTMEEIHAAFSKFGLIKEDENKQPRIKMYR
eukprot:scaffold173991_cov22-Tisochrysis_lutea.AAC.2